MTAPAPQSPDLTPDPTPDLAPDPAEIARWQRRKRRKGLALRAYVAALLALPYDWRVGLAGWLGSSAPVRRSRRGRAIRDAIAELIPDRAAEAESLAAEVLANTGRTQIEVLSGAPFAARAARAPITGPGWPVLQAAHAACRPAILLVSHFGNSAAVGPALLSHGIEVGSLYKPLPVPQVDATYVAAMLQYTRPMFPTDRTGVGALLRHLKGGGMVSISFDLDRSEGVRLDFMGRPTRTMLSMAQLALRYDAPLIPVYGLRRPGLPGFEAVLETPIPHSDPETMMQEANDRLAAMVRKHPGQWLWWHRRWKGGADDDAG